MSQGTKQLATECLYRLCACAGPLMTYEIPPHLSCCLESLVSAGRLTTLRRGYIAKEQLRLSKLRSLLTDELRDLLLQLEKTRQGFMNFRVESIRGRVRNALVLENNSLFNQLIEAYGAGEQIGWHPDRDYHEFWTEVLGEKLHDSRLLPAGQHRNELIHHVLKRTCVTQIPSDIALPTPPLGHVELIGLAFQYCKQHKNEQLLQLHISYPQETLITAFVHLSQGELQLAHQHFLKNFGISSNKALRIHHYREDFILPIAIQNAMNIGASPALIRTWMSYAEQTLLRSLERSPSIHQELRQTLYNMRPIQAKPHESTMGGAVHHYEQAPCIFWDIRLNDKHEIEVLEARLLDESKQSRAIGKSLSLTKLTEGNYISYCDAADMDLIKELHPSLTNASEHCQLSTRSLAALCQHPRLRLVAPNGEPKAIQIQLVNNGEKNAFQLNEEFEGLYHLYLPGYTEEQTTNTEPCARLHYRDQELTLLLNAAAQQAIDALLEQIPLIHQGRCLAMNAWRFKGIPLALQVVQALNAHQVPISWKQCTPLTLHHDACDSIELHASGSMQRWLSLGAELKLNEELILNIRDLLHLWEKREGDFLDLGNQHYLPLSETSLQQLSFLQSATELKGDKIKLHRSKLMHLAQAWEGHEHLLKGKLHAQVRQLLSQLNEPIHLPPSVCATLRPYQQEGFKWLVQRARCGLGSCLADEMGLGKTLQILALLQHQSYEGASLVIAPLSLLSNWAAEAARFCPELDVSIISRKISQLDLSPGKIYITSYGQLLVREELRIASWNVLVIDEAQAIKNHRSQRSKVLLRMQAKSRIAATATPIENKLTELWSIMNVLNPSMLGPYKDYNEKVPSAATKEKLHHLVAPLMLRRHKEDVLQELPELIEVTMGIEFSEEERALYESHRRHALELLERGNEHQSFKALTQLTLLRRLCCHAGLVAKGFTYSSKIDALIELVRNLRQEGHRALIFSQFTDVLKLARQAIKSALGFECAYLDGRTSAKRRHELVNTFQKSEAGADEGRDFFLISLKAGGSGLNLTGADYVILLDPWWNPAVEQQAMGRAHRIGQQRPVTLCRLICHDSIEERVLEMHKEKQMLADTLDALPQMELQGLLQLLH